MSVTQKQIAERLGLSRVSIAHALNGTGRLGEETRSRIIKEATRMGYRRHSNQDARTLIAKRYGKLVNTGIAAVLFSAGTIRRSEPYFTPIFEGLEIGANELGLEHSLCPAYTSTLPRLISQRNVDGVIDIFNENLDHKNQIVELGLPLVVVEQAPEGFHRVTSDTRRGALMAIEHLVELGHRRIAYLGHDGEFWSNRERLAGYREGLAAHSLPVRQELIETSIQFQSREASAKSMQRLLSRTRDFTAVLCYNDMIAMGAIRQMQADGLRIPDDISVVGFDDISQQYEFVPRLTSVSVGTELGRRAMQLLNELIEQGIEAVDSEDNSPRHEVVSVQLVVRGSTRRIKT